MSKTNEVKNRLTKLLAALEAKYGALSVISLAQMIEVRDQLGAEEFTNSVIYVRKNPDYKIARNQFVVTTSETPALERDKVLATRQSGLLPEAVRKDPEKLAKLATKTAAPVKKQAAQVVKPKSAKSLDAHTTENMDAFEGHDEVSSGDINDLLRINAN